MALKRIDDLQPGDRIRMAIGHATITEVKPLKDSQTQLTFLYGTVGRADNDVTVDVLPDDEWGSRKP